MSRSSVAVVGNGFVGGSLTTVFDEQGFDVYVYDKAGALAQGGKNKVMLAHKSVLAEMDNGTRLVQKFIAEPNSVNELVRAVEQVAKFSGIYFVCVPTPMKKDGSCDTSIVEGVLWELADFPGDRIAVVKSTVPPGSTVAWNAMFNPLGLRVVFCPEFLTEANALDDMRNQDRIILGGPMGAVERVEQVMSAAFPGVPVHKTTSTNAEMVKYVGNCYLALKVSYANEVYQVVEGLQKTGLDADYDRVIELATLDKRLGISHWKVPGPMRADTAAGPATGEYSRGFGGSCLSKDPNAWIAFAKGIGVKPTMVEAAWQKNLEVRPGQDWLELKGRAVSEDE